MPRIYRAPPPDAIKSPNNIATPSPFEAEALEEALENMAEGGVF